MLNALDPAENAQITKRFNEASGPLKKWHKLHKLGVANKPLSPPFLFSSPNVLTSHYANIVNSAASITGTAFNEILRSPPLVGFPTFHNPPHH